MVAERQTVQHRRQRDEAPRDPRGLRPRKLRGVRVPLLRHDARPRRVRLIELRPPSAGSVQRARSAARRERWVAQIRGVGQELLDEVTDRHGVDRVVERASEPEVGRRLCGIEREGRRRERAGPERRHGHPHGRLVEALQVAEQRPRVR